MASRLSPVAPPQAPCITQVEHWNRRWLRRRAGTGRRWSASAAHV